MRLETAASGRGISMQHICEGPINAKQSTQVLEQHCQPDKVFFTDVVAYFSKNMQNNNRISQQQIFIELFKVAEIWLLNAKTLEVWYSGPSL